jgi:hypothetical protein
LVRTAPSCLIPVKSYPDARFNFLLGHNYFPVPFFRREFSL